MLDSNRSEPMVVRDRQVTAARFEILTSAPQVLTPRPLVIFDGAPVPPLSIRPDWIDEVEVETTWRTDVTVSRAGNQEERFQLQTRPVRTLTVTITATTNEETHALAQALMAYAFKNAPAPLYCDQLEVVSTEVLSGGRLAVFGDTAFKRFFPNQRVVVNSKGDQSRQSDNFVQWAEIDQVDIDKIVLKTTPSRVPVLGDLIFPCIDVEINEQASGTFLVDDKLKTRITWKESVGPSCLPASFPPFSYDNLLSLVAYAEDGVPIFDFDPDWSNGIQVTALRRGERTPSGTGDIFDPEGVPYHEFEFDFLAEKREIHWALLRFFDAMRGRTSQFYLLNPADPWKLWPSLPFNGTSAANIYSLASHEEIVLHFTHAAFIRANGSIVVREIDDTDDLGTHYRFDLVVPLPDTNFVGVRPIHKSRLSNDTFSEKWLTDGVAASSLKVTEIRTFQDVSTPTNANLLLFDTSRVRTAIEKTNPQFWFDSGENVYFDDLDLGNTALRTADEWPSNSSKVWGILDSREQTPQIIDKSFVLKYPYLKAAPPPSTSTIYATKIRFSGGVWQNNNKTSIAAAYFDLSIQTITPLLLVNERHLWGDLGWTLVFVITPYNQIKVPGVESDLIKIVDGSSSLVFRLVGAHYAAGGGGRTACGIDIRDNGGTLRNIVFNASLIDFSSVQILVIRWDASVGRLHCHRQRNQLISGGSGFFSLSSIFKPTSYSKSGWGEGVLGFDTLVNTNSTNGFGQKGALNSVLNWRRPLTSQEVNDVAKEIVSMYNTTPWQDITY